MSEAFQYSANFNAAVANIFKLEGGYVNDPDDAGGETNFGISKRSYPGEDIAGMTRDRAEYLYHRDYWELIKGDLYTAPVGAKMLDMAVNMGPRRAIIILQRALGVTPDGLLGARTFVAIGSASTGLLDYLRAAQKAYYLDLIADHPQFEVFRRGWLARAAS